jgi:signal transduction histidine kinase/plastocyanin
VLVEAGRPGPFSIGGSSRIGEITLRAGEPAMIDFVNNAADGLAFPHNLSVYRTTAPGDVIFTGEIVVPNRVPPAEIDEHDPNCCFESARVRYSFTAPEAGIYAYRCDVHPVAMNGIVRVLSPGATQIDSEVVPPALFDVRGVLRRVAEVSHGAEGTAQVALDYLFSALSFGLAVFLVRLRPRDRLARLFGVAMLGTATSYNLQGHAALATYGAFSTLHTVFHATSGAAYIYALLLFPDGRLVPRWSSAGVRVVYRMAMFFAVMWLLGITGLLEPEFGNHPASFVLFFGLIIPGVGIAAQSYRLRSRHPSAEQRQQSRLLVWALSVALGIGVLLLLLVGVVFRASQGPQGYAATFADPAFRVFQPLFAVIPIALFVGILRYRLWDADLVINKTILYGALAAFIGGVYVAVVVGVGNALAPEGSLVPTIVATALVAVAFEPVRRRVRRVADRLVYGRRASPYEVMADFSSRLAGALSFEEVLPRMAEAAARGVGATRARVRLFLPGDGERAVAYPPAASNEPFDRLIPVVHQREVIGELAVSKRPSDPLTTQEDALLAALASQAGVALHSVRLTEQLHDRLAQISTQAAELVASRQRIVSARDAERRRLEREIRDRIERQLASMSEVLARVGPQLRRSPKRAEEHLEAVAALANQTQETLRDLARGIFPPLLADRGLLAALEGQIRKLGVDAEITGRSALRSVRFDARAEAAVYFCCVEAIRNASRYAAGSPVTVRLSFDDGWVSFEVGDEGPGFDPAGLPSDSSIQAMSDRVAALGGMFEVRSAPGRATVVAGRVPAQPEVAAAQSSANLSGSNEDLGTKAIAPHSAALDP